MSDFCKCWKCGEEIEIGNMSDEVALTYPPRYKHKNCPNDKQAEIDRLKRQLEKSKDIIKMFLDDIGKPFECPHCDKGVFQSRHDESCPVEQSEVFMKGDKNNGRD